MKFIVVDVESDGPIPVQNSMVCFGACVVDKKLDKTFYGKTAPLKFESTTYDSKALAVSGFTHEEHLKFPDPFETMMNFKEWLLKIKGSENESIVFISDNNGYDWQWINWYLHYFTGSNPFGFSSRRIGDIWCGLNKDLYAKWKWLRETKHTHNPADDAKGNAEALIKILEKGIQGYKL